MAMLANRRTRNVRQFLDGEHRRAGGVPVRQPEQPLAQDLELERK